MPDIKKPISTLELATAAVSLVKTAAVIFALMMLEWARLKERKAKVEALKAQNDLEVQKIQTSGVTDAKGQIDRYLNDSGLAGGSPSPGDNPEH